MPVVGGRWRLTNSAPGVAETVPSCDLMWPCPEQTTRHCAGPSQMSLQLFLKTSPLQGLGKISPVWIWSISGSERVERPPRLNPWFPESAKLPVWLWDHCGTAI